MCSVKKLSFLPGIAILLVSLWMSESGSAATISGNVTIAGEKPIRAALTLHDLSTRREAGHLPFDRRFASHTDGSFSIAGVPAGRYEVCVDAPAEDVLDPCDWSDSAPSVAVADGDAVTGFAVSVAVGTKFRVRVSDPDGLLSGSPRPAADVLLMSIISRQSRVHPMRVLSAGDLEREFYAIVPIGEDVTFVGESRTQELRDGISNRRLPDDAHRVPFRAAAGSPPAPVSLSIHRRTGAAEPRTGSR